MSVRKGISKVMHKFRMKFKIVGLLIICLKNFDIRLILVNIKKFERLYNGKLKCSNKEVLLIKDLKNWHRIIQKK